jgi:hypothetical protein
MRSDTDPTTLDSADDRLRLRRSSIPDLLAELRDTEAEIQRPGLIADSEGLTPLIQLALRELQILRELRRRKLLAAAHR